MGNILSQCHEFNFSETYAYADKVRKEIFSDNSLYEPVELASDLELQISKPQRHTILHDYIEYIVSDDIRFFFTGPLWDYDCIDPVFEMLDSHSVKYFSLHEYVANLYREDDSDLEPEVHDNMLEENRYEYCTEYIEALVNERVVPIIVTEVFNLLFGDRKAMMQFNITIAEYMGEKTTRCTYWNTWLKNALLHREKGVCALCKTNLTAMYNTSNIAAVDHIVPIALGGVNDPTNLQLLCQPCNGKKSGNEIITSSSTPLYWEEI